MLETMLVLIIVGLALVAAAFAMKRLSKVEGGCSTGCSCGDLPVGGKKAGPESACANTGCEGTPASCCGTEKGKTHVR